MDAVVSSRSRDRVTHDCAQHVNGISTVRTLFVIGIPTNIVYEDGDNLLMIVVMAVNEGSVLSTSRSASKADDTAGIREFLHR
jgi:hypothetical protein